MLRPFTADRAFNLLSRTAVIHNQSLGLMSFPARCSINSVIAFQLRSH